MKRTRLRKGSVSMKDERLKRSDWTQSSTPKHMSMADLLEKKVYRFLHEAGHDVHSFDDSLHAYLHHAEEDLERAGHSVEARYKKWSSKDNHAYFQIMPGKNPEHRRVSMANMEEIVHKLYPDSKVEWAHDPGVHDPTISKSQFETFKVSNVSLADIIVINNVVMQYGGGICLVKVEDVAEAQKKLKGQMFQSG